MKECHCLENGMPCPGCGPQLGLKLALQTFEKCVLVNSTGCITSMTNYPHTPFSVPFLHAGPDAAAAASGVAHGVKGVPVIAYAGSMHIQSLILAAERDDNFIYINYNISGKSYAKALAPYAAYVATASIAYPDDYITKLRKAASIEGMKFIDLLAPCPKLWFFDPSNTIEVSRLAVETAFWPLYEIENKKLVLTKRPTRLEPVERFFELQKRLVTEDKEKIQETVNKNWKLLSEGKIL